jgi:hypothetical protein
LDDFGGTCQLWYSVDGSYPFSLVNSAPWQHDLAWSDAGDLDAGSYYALEVGNGTAYLGASQKSETVVI